MRPPPVSLSVMAGLDPAIHTRPAYPAGHSQRRPLRWSWPGLTRRSRFPSWPGLTRPSMGMDSRVQPANDGRGVARRAALRPLITRVRPLKQLRLSWRSRFPSWPGLTRPATGIDSRVQPANDGWGVARRAALRPLITRVRPLKQFRLSWRSRFLSWPGLTRPSIWPRLGMTDHRVTLFSEPDTVTMKRSIIEARHARGGAGGTAQP